MPDPKLIRVYYEGDDDRVVLEGLQDCVLLPANAEIAKRDKKHAGKDGLVHEFAAFVRPVNGASGSAIALVDLDDLNIGQRTSWFENKLAEECKGASPPIALVAQKSGDTRLTMFTLSSEQGSGRVALISVGLIDNQQLREQDGIQRFAIDDHILQLVRDPRVYGAVSELELVSHELGMRKIKEVAGQLRNNGIETRHSKRLLHILRAVAAVRPSSATFIERLMKKAKETLSKDEIKALFHPLVADLEEAARMLNS